MRTILSFAALSALLLVVAAPSAEARYRGTVTVPYYATSARFEAESLYWDDEEYYYRTAPWQADRAQLSSFYRVDRNRVIPRYPRNERFYQYLADRYFRGELGGGDIYSHTFSSPSARCYNYTVYRYSRWGTPQRSGCTR